MLLLSFRSTPSATLPETPSAANRTDESKHVSTFGIGTAQSEPFPV